MISYGYGSCHFHVFPISKDAVVVFSPSEKKNKSQSHNDRKVSSFFWGQDSGLFLYNKDK